MKILAAIVIYNPDWSLLGDNIRAFYDHVDHILVWNNSDARIRLSDIRGLQPFFQKTTYKTLHKNVGIAQALNYAWHYAKEHGYDTLLTMDDDSVFEDFGTYRQRVEQHWQANGLSLCGPAAQPTKERGMQRVRHLITSGMMVPLALLEKAGGYCELFHVDGIDIELCVNLARQNIYAWRDNDSLLRQRYGTPATKRWGPVTLHSPNYSPQRLHDIFCNHIIILRKHRYPLHLVWHIVRLYFIGFVCKGVLLVETNKKQKLKAVVKGIKDGFRSPIH